MFFLFQKNGSRVYQVGTNLVEIPNMVIQSFIRWSLPPHNEDRERDKRLATSLLLVLVSEEKLKAFDVDDASMQFVRGSLRLP